MARGNVRPIILIVLTSAVLAFAVTYLFMPRGPRREQPTLPGPLMLNDADRLDPLYDVPDFTLTNQDGETVSRDDLRGRVWIADFIFTRCPSICPRLTANMAALQQRLDANANHADVRLVSFSVDPHHDTPEVLKAFAQKYEADLSRWTFLTGDRDEVWQLVEKGFRLGVSDQPDNLEMPIAHSPKFALVDQAGRVRRYYDGTTQHEFDELLEDIDTLLQDQ